MRVLRCLIVILALSGNTMPAQAGEDPKLVAKAYVAALKARAWQRIADLMDPRELRDVHGFIVPVLKKLVVQRRAWPAPFKQMLEGLTTPADVGKLTPRQVFIRLVKGTIRSISRRRRRARRRHLHRPRAGQRDANFGSCGLPRRIPGQKHPFPEPVGHYANPVPGPVAGQAERKHASSGADIPEVGAEIIVEAGVRRSSTLPNDRRLTNLAPRRH